MASEADTKTTNIAKLIAVTKKYTRINELTILIPIWFNPSLTNVQKFRENRK